MIIKRGKVKGHLSPVAFQNRFLRERKLAKPLEELKLGVFGQKESSLNKFSIFSPKNLQNTGLRSTNSSPNQDKAL